MMTFYQEEVLDRLDAIDDAVLEAEANVAIAMASAYLKEAMIMESCMDVSAFDFYLESGKFTPMQSVDAAGNVTGKSDTQVASDNRKAAANAAKERTKEGIENGKKVNKLMKEAKGYFDMAFKNLNAQLAHPEGPAPLTAADVEAACKAMNKALDNTAKQVHTFLKKFNGALNTGEIRNRSEASSPAKIRVKNIISKIGDVIVNIFKSIAGFFKWIVGGVIGFFKKIGKRDRNGNIVMTFEEAAAKNLIEANVRPEAYKDPEAVKDFPALKGRRTEMYKKSVAVTENFKKYGIIAYAFPGDDGKSYVGFGFKFISDEQIQDITDERNGALKRYTDTLGKIGDLLLTGKTSIAQDTSQALVSMLRDNLSTITETQKVLREKYKGFNEIAKGIDSGKLRGEDGKMMPGSRGEEIAKGTSQIRSEQAVESDR